MTAKPKVSVIVPCFNRQTFIADTVESVLSQSYPHFDLIVVDDGCTDGSRQIIERYCEQIFIIEHPGRANRGQSASINLALGISKGKYVAILDSDDLWFPDKLAEQVAYLEDHPHVGMVFGNGEAVDEGGGHLYSIYESHPPGDLSPDSLLVDCYIHLPTNSMIRKSVLDRVGGFDESLRAAQDHDMLLRIAETSKMAYLDRVWYKYRRHNGSISYSRAEMRWRGGFRILEKAAARYPYSPTNIRKRKAVLYFRLGQCHYAAGRFFHATTHFLMAFLLDSPRALRYISGLERSR